MKKLLILGGSRYIIPAIKAAHQLGVYVISCDYLPDNIGHRYSDEYHNVSIIEKEKVLELAGRLHVDGILSFATDPGVEAAAYAAEKLGLPTSPYESVHILQNKNLFRAFLKEHGFNVPWFKSYSNITEAIQDAETFPFPVIVKPVDSAGSKGVRRVNSGEELKDAISYALTYSHNGCFIIEEFIEQQGHSSGSECFSIDGKLVFSSFACQHFDFKANNPYTPCGTTWPSDMPVEAVRQLHKELQRLVQLLQMGTSIYNVECRLGTNGKTYLMEVSPRAGGNRLAEVLRYACGQDLIMNNVKAALGISVENMKEPKYSGSWGLYMLHTEKEGVFDHLWIDPKVEHKYIVEKDVWVQSGEYIYPFTGANRAIGTLIFRCDSDEAARSLILNHGDWCKVIMK